MTTNGTGVSDTPQVKKVVVCPMEFISSTSVSHHGYDVPIVPVTLIHNDVNLDDKLHTSEMNNRSDSTPVTQPSPFFDKALAELRGVQVENKRLTSENQSQQRSITHLKIALDKRNESLIKIINQLAVTTSSLTLE